MSSGLKWVLGKVRKIDNTPAFMRSFGASIWPVVQRTGQNIERTVKTTAPFRTGNLRRSYHVQLFREQLRAKVGSDPGIAIYAAAVEFGTSRSRAQPHLGPAGMAQKDTFKTEIRQAIENTLVAWGGKK